MRVNPEKKEERDRTTRALLRATLRLAAAHGFTSLGLREVARAADIAPTSFYRHFADMEELGLTLIADLVGPFVEEWITPGRSVPRDEGSALDALVSRAFLSVSADPELMRFVLAERLGAIVSFRVQLARQLASVPPAILEAWSAESDAERVRVAAHLTDATLSLLLEGCGQALEHGQAQAPAVRKRVVAQIRALLAGATRNSGKP